MPILEVIYVREKPVNRCLLWLEVCKQMFTLNLAMVSFLWGNAFQKS